jgi:hypothetical protein
MLVGNLAELFWDSDNDMLRSWSARNGSNGAYGAHQLLLFAANASFPHAFPPSLRVQSQGSLTWE